MRSYGFIIGLSYKVLGLFSKVLGHFCSTCAAEEELILLVRRSGLGPAKERAEMRCLPTRKPRQAVPISAV